MDWYQVLGITPNSDKEEVKSAFRKKVRLYHPDTTSIPDKQKASELFKELKQAFDLIYNKAPFPVRRRKLDKTKFKIYRKGVFLKEKHKELNLYQFNIELFKEIGECGCILYIMLENRPSIQFPLEVIIEIPPDTTTNKTLIVHIEPQNIVANIILLSEEDYIRNYKTVVNY